MVAGEALRSGAGDGGDDASGGIDAADAVVAGVGEVEIVCGVEGERSGKVELSGGGEGVVAGEAGGRAGDGGDDASGEVQFADAVVVGVCNVEIAGAAVPVIEGEALWRIECGGSGGAIVAGEALRAGAGDGGDLPVGVDFADVVVSGFGDIEVAGGIEDDRGGQEKGDGESGGLG